MLKNYLRTSFRYLTKNKAYTAINVLGLAVGLACFLLLTIFVEQEFSYDEFHSKKDLIYQVFLRDTADHEGEYQIQTQAPMGPLVVESIPEIVQASRFLSQSDKVVKVGNQRYITNGVHYGDVAAFDMFDFPLLTGSKEDLEMTLNDILVSEKEAIKLFGRADLAVGKELEIVDVGTFIVKEVFADLPEDTHMNFEYILSFEGAQKPFEGFGGNRTVFEWGFLNAFPLYIELANSDVSVEEIQAKIAEVLLPHRGRTVKLVPLTDVYFSELSRFPFGKRGNKQYAQLYLIIAIIILLVAAVNYMNMATARQAKRSKEVGIRKTVGGNRQQIIKQFLTESLVIAFISMILGICLAELAIPTLSEFVGKPVNIDYRKPMTILFLLGSASFIGLISGAYPALYLSRFNPIQILAGQMNKRGGFSFRQVLVAFQFFICLGLMTVTGIVFKQFKYMAGVDKGFNDEMVVSISTKDKSVQENYQAFKADLLQSPLIKGVSGAAFSVFTLSSSFYIQPEGMEERVPISVMQVEKTFLQDLEIGLSDGEGFNLSNQALNKGKILINKSAQENFGWDEPLTKKIKELNYDIIGVTNDFLFGSAKEAIAPLMMTASDKGYEHAYVRLATNNISESIAYIQSSFEKFAKEYPFEYSFLDDDFAKKYEKEQKLSQVFSAFSLLAIFIAGLGILGLSIYIVEQRIKEIGIRRVLGAKIANIVWLLNKGTTLMIGLVAIIVLPLVHIIMESWLKEFNQRIDLGLALYILPLLGLLLMIWLILLNQSIKSARTNPVNALRTE